MRAAPDHAAGQSGRKKSQDRAGGQNHALQSRPALERSENYVRAPLPGVPGCAGLGEGVKILMRNPALIEDVLAGADVPADISIGEQALPAGTAGGKQPAQD